jgi:hypothetical protein
MSNNNLADISTFEQLQNQTNQSVVDIIKDIQKAFSTVVKTDKKRKKAMDDENKNIRNYQTACKILTQKITAGSCRIKKQLEQNPNDTVLLKNKKILDSIIEKTQKILII